MVGEGVAAIEARISREHDEFLARAAPSLADLAPLPASELSWDGRVVTWRPHPQWSARVQPVRDGWQVTYGVAGARPGSEVAVSVAGAVVVARAMWERTKAPRSPRAGERGAQDAAYGAAAGGQRFFFGSCAHPGTSPGRHQPR